MVPVPAPTLMEALKGAVAGRHARMEALPFVTALTGGRLPLPSYVGQLRAMAVIHSTLEHELALLGPDPAGSLLADRPSRLVHLRRDLSVFDPLLVPDLKAAQGPARELAALIRRQRMERPADLLGIIYILEGTTLGNAVHLPDVLRTFGRQTGGTAHYYAGYGEASADCWRTFSRAMNGFPLDPDGRQRVIRAALRGFDLLEALYSALCPVQDDGTCFTAGMLNPEAGDHPVPQDAGVLAAAVAAGHRCRLAFPYFEARFGERGRGFAQSDAAWLATLTALPAADLLGQVEWLGRVLGNRGIPRITLERQLEWLHAGLAALPPERAGDCRGLLEAAEQLKRERFQHVPEPAWEPFAQAFRLATGDELEGRMQDTGTLILSAVCDRAAGIAGAVDSLRPWLTDPDRFAPDWSAAVAAAFGRAQGEIRARP